MCTPQDEGQPQSKRGTQRWYDTQAEALEEEQRRWDGNGWWRCEAIRRLRRGPVAWFRWVFLNLDDHEPDCRWRRLVQRWGVA